MPPISTIAFGLDVASILGVIYSPLDTKFKIITIILCIMQYMAFAYNWIKSPGVIGTFLTILLMCTGNVAMIAICYVAGIWIPLLPIFISCLFKSIYTFVKCQ